MGPVERQALLERWMSRHSDAEEVRMDRAERMVTAAIDAHPAFDGYRSSIKVYAKGSYANQTNVRLDSDVDIVVENRDLYYFDYNPRDSAPAPDPRSSPYTGRWQDYREWRTEVTAALQAAFGSESVDTSGKVAITIAEVSGSRPSADVVPSFHYRRFERPDRSVIQEGSRVFSTTGDAINNFPAQQKQNGAEKDRATSGRYKKFVRALKSAENYLAEQKEIKDLPSYFMECLVWNVPTQTINTGYALDDGFRETLRYLIAHLHESNFKTESWEEPNGLKWLFRGQSKWTPAEGLDLAVRTYLHLGHNQ